MPPDPAIKICGLNSEEAIRATIAARADYAGFVHFSASPRHVSFEQAAALKALLPPSIQSVCVLVDPNDALLEHLHPFRPDYLQLHGSETPARLRAIRQSFPHYKLIKAIPVRTAADIAQSEAFRSIADLIMFDAKPTPAATLPGGNGLSFDWTLLQGKNFPFRWFLSGGLTPGNVAEALRITDASMFDVSSGVEHAPGVKDPALIHAFTKAARHET